MFFGKRFRIWIHFKDSASVFHLLNYGFILFFIYLFVYSFNRLFEFFSWTVIRPALEWFIIINCIVSSDYDCQNFPCSFFLKENILVFLDVIAPWIYQIFKLFSRMLLNYNHRVKLLANIFFLPTNTKILVCWRNIITHFVVSNQRHVISESIFNFFDQKALKFCSRYLFSNY